jgi:hypothetical protein
MNACVLLEKLINIERSIGVDGPTLLHMKVIDAQECLLEMQKEMAESAQHPEKDRTGTLSSSMRQRVHA